MIELFSNHINGLIDAGLDWDKMMPLAGRHGMVALLYKHLAKFPDAGIPSSFLTQLRRQNKAHHVQQLTLTERMLKISKLLDRMDIIKSENVIQLKTKRCPNT